MDTPKYAHILVQERSLKPIGRLTIYEWVGDPRLPVWIPFSLDVKLLPWPLRDLDMPDYSRVCRLYMRTDARWWPLAFVWIAFKDKFYRASVWFKTRIILTLVVWGIGHMSDGHVPEWKDLFK